MADAREAPKVGKSAPRGNAGKGRKKGSVNKTTKEAKEAIELAFEGIGGVNALILWAEDNKSVFYSQVWPKLLPIQHKHGGDADNTTPILFKTVYEARGN